MDEIEVQASSVEAAIKEALEALDATLDEVDTKILEPGKRGRVLGFGARNAVVLVTRRKEGSVRGFDDEDEDEEDGGDQYFSEAKPRRGRGRRGSRNRRRSPAPRSERSDSRAEVSPRRKPESESSDAAVPRQPRPEPEPMDAAMAEEARVFIGQFLAKMGFDAEAEIIDGDPPVFNIRSASDQDMAGLIGSRGETLRQFGFLVSSMLGRQMGQSVRIVIDVDNYRSRREDSIRELAMEAAAAVRETGRTVTLRVMPGHERRIVHMSLAEDDDVHTYSVGQNRSRRVVIALKQ